VKLQSSIWNPAPYFVLVPTALVLIAAMFDTTRPQLFTLGIGWNTDELRDSILRDLASLVPLPIFLWGIWNLAAATRYRAGFYVLVALLIMLVVVFNWELQPVHGGRDMDPANWSGDKEWADPEPDDYYFAYWISGYCLILATINFIFGGRRQQSST
jgi:hypothetical protein